MHHTSISQSAERRCSEGHKESWDDVVFPQEMDLVEEAPTRERASSMRILSTPPAAEHKFFNPPSAPIPRFGMSPMNAPSSSGWTFPSPPMISLQSPSNTLGDLELPPARIRDELRGRLPPEPDSPAMSYTRKRPATLPFPMSPCLRSQQVARVGYSHVSPLSGQTGSSNNTSLSSSPLAPLEPLVNSASPPSFHAQHSTMPYSNAVFMPAMHRGQ